MNESDVIKSAMGVEESDIKYAMQELFKDKKEANNFFSVDLRTRLRQKEVRSLSIISFLQSINLEESNNKITPTLCDGLENLALAIKRYKISLDGKSREEIVELFKANLENEKKQGFFGGMFQPQH